MKYVIQVEEFNGSMVERHVFDTAKARNKYLHDEIIPLLPHFRMCRYSVYVYQCKRILEPVEN